MTNIINAMWRVAYRIAYALQRVYWFIRRPTVEGVYVAVWHDRQILLIQNSYKRYRTIPSGLRRRHEAARDGAMRELREEVGLEVAADRLRQAAEFTIAFEHKSDHVFVFEIELSQPAAIAVDHREVVAAWFATVPEALAEPLSPVVRRYLVERESGV